MSGAQLILRTLLDVVVDGGIGTAIGFGIGASIDDAIDSRNNDTSHYHNHVTVWVMLACLTLGAIIGVARNRQNIQAWNNSRILNALDKALNPHEKALTAIGYDLVDVPDELCDPITKRIFHHPVILTTRQTYERSTIPMLNGRCAITMQLFDPKNLVADNDKIADVKNFIEQQKIIYQVNHALVLNIDEEREPREQLCFDCWGLFSRQEHRLDEVDENFRYVPPQV